MNKIITIIVITLAVFAGQQKSNAQQAPASAEQLRAAFEKSFHDQDTNAIFALCNWQGVSEQIKSFQCAMLMQAAKNGVANVKLIPLPKNQKLVFEGNGVRYSPNVEVVGLIHCDYVQTISDAKMAMDLPYGKVGDKFMLSCSKEEKILTNAAPQK